MSSISRVIHSDPDILGGTPVFIDTRVPMKNLIDYLEAGDSLDQFLDHFPVLAEKVRSQPLKTSQTSIATAFTLDTIVDTDGN